MSQAAVCKTGLNCHLCHFSHSVCSELSHLGCLEKSSRTVN